MIRSSWRSRIVHEEAGVALVCFPPYESLMKKISRKTFLASGLSVPLAPVLSKSAPKTSPNKASSVKLGISSYSYWHFR
ncbi:MAG: hypothetical protein HN531_04655, partial [Opitutae bacterium]|nr:hypothetical protein [Opitutae bacterium]